MSSEWPLVRLEEITSVLGDGLHGTPIYDDGGDYHFINGNNLLEGRIVINEKTKRVTEAEAHKHRKNLNERTILVSINGTLGNIAFYCGERVILGKSACYFNVDTGVDKHFVRYVLQSDTFQNYIHNLATGSTIKNVSLRLMRDFSFQLPPFEVQERISATLKALDDRIALLRETNATLEAIAQALFKSWFVDFDPVHARTRGEVPAGLSSEVAALFPDRFEESELGMVPKGWKVGVLGEVAETVRKQIQPGAMTADALYVGLEHIPRQSLGLNAWGTAEELESAKSCFEKGDVLFGKLRPYFHKIVIAPFDGVCSTDILVCRAKSPEYYAFVLMHLFSTELVSYADRLSNGAKMPRVNWKDLAAYQVTIPPTELALTYMDVVKPMFAQITDNVLQAQTLATLRDTLLPRLISGQLRLSEVT